MSISKILLGCLLITLGHAIGWFHMNSQFIWGWWKDKPILALIIFSLPAGIFFWYGGKIAFNQIGEFWAVRFLAFALSYLVFPFLAWHFMGESFFTPKTIICVLLSFVIVLIQVLWR